MFEGEVKWGFLYNNECKICNIKNACTDECKHRKHCKLYVIKNDEGEDIVRIKRLNVNAKLPVRGTMGQQGMNWLRRKLQ